MKIFSKNEKGSITLFTLIAMMFFLTIAFTAYASAMAKLQAQNDDLERIKASYEQDLTEEGLRELYNKLTGTRDWLPGEGTEQNPYKIYKIEDLMELSNKTNSGTSYEGKYIELMNDLDFNNINSYEKADRTDFGDVNNNGTVEGLRTELTTGQGWQAIGTASKAFSGKFDGNNYIINNLYINTTADRTGMFGCISSASISNLNVKGKIESNNGNYVGIIGYSRFNSIITNCSSDLKITILMSSGTCYAGGIFGVGSDSFKIYNCINYGEIKVTGNSNLLFTGGIVGKSEYARESSLIEDCINYGNISGGHSTGGLVGENRTGIIRKCINYGNINASIVNTGNTNAKAGGIAGHNYWTSTRDYGEGNIINCFNTGTISSEQYTGGIVGYNDSKDRAIIKNCYNIGNIAEGRFKGGIANGYRDLIINNQWLNSCGAEYGIGTLSSNTGADPKSETEMKQQSFVDLLNSNQEDVPWTMDTNNINNGYPILKWQLNQ